MHCPSLISNTINAVLHCYTATVLQCYTATLLHCYTATVPKCYSSGVVAVPLAGYQTPAAVL